jgi:hypothetical protein
MLNTIVYCFMYHVIPFNIRNIVKSQGFLQDFCKWRDYPNEFIVYKVGTVMKEIGHSWLFGMITKSLNAIQ